VRCAVILACLVALVTLSPAAAQTDRPSEVSAPQPTSSAPGESRHPDVHEIMRRAIAKDIVNWEAARNYTFIERTQESKLDNGGRVQSSKTETSEITILYGEPFERLIARDDKPLSAREQKKQDDQFEKETRKRENESPAEREKRIREFEKNRQDERTFVQEVLQAYDFTLAGEETVNGRKTWVVDAQPRPGFEAKRKEAKILPKIKPRFWIDQQDHTWVKLRGDVLDTMSFGWVIARIHKGSQFELQQTRVNEEVWLPLRVDVRLDARVALLKGVNEDFHVTYSEYRKFRTETKIVPIAGTPTE
jgi:hypothetical protein